MTNQLEISGFKWEFNYGRTLIYVMSQMSGFIDQSLAFLCLLWDTKNSKNFYTHTKLFLQLGQSAVYRALFPTNFLNRSMQNFA